MFREKNKWLTLTVINLAIVALLGVILRSKIMFSIPGIDFKNFLQSHSHFAFGGWVTLCILSLMTYEILPAEQAQRPIYRWLLTGVFICACGMLLSFPFEGYAFVSILFSTLFIFITYVFTCTFIGGLVKSTTGKTIKLLSICALLALSLSSVGPFTLAYILASHSTNTLIYRDAIYTYLHLQYNGFFTLGVFALVYNQIKDHASPALLNHAKRFALLLCISVLPTMCLSYLWHFENIIVRTVAIIGCFCLVLVLVSFFSLMNATKDFQRSLPRFARHIGLLSMIAFALKTIVQIGIVFPSVGKAVFGNRPIIIGYLHLVMLGFVTLYLLSHLLRNGFFAERKVAKTGIIIFATGVIANELVLMTQGLTAMMMMSSTQYPLYLLIAAIWLFVGATTIAVSSLKGFKNAQYLTQ